MGRAIELRKDGRTGCRLPSELEEGNTAAALHASGCPVLRSRESPRTLRNNMHENREISSAPSAIGEGRSAKATGRTADMHALEKSDCAVVPVNQPNKEAKVSAEVGEGRAQLKENIIQPHMLLTQSRNFCMSQRLDGVREANRSLGFALRHSFFRRAVCVDALVRICAGGDP